MKQGTDIIIHETAIIKRPELVEMGSHVAIDPFFYMTTKGKFGDWIHINSHVSVIGGEDSILEIGNGVAISTGCRLICRSNDFNFTVRAIPFAPEVQMLYGKHITIKDKVILGVNVVVLPDVTIGEGVRVGANSLVKEDLEPWGIYVGSPCHKIGECHD